MPGRLTEDFNDGIVFLRLNIAYQISSVRNSYRAVLGLSLPRPRSLNAPAPRRAKQELGRLMHSWTQLGLL